MSLPLIILAVFSIFFGYITKDIFIGLGSGFFADNSLFIHPTHEIMLDTEFAVPTLFKLLPLFFTISLSALAIVFSEFLPKILIFFKFSRLGYNIFGFFNQRFLIELFYNKYITGLILKLGGQTTKVIDKGSVELLGPYGLEKILIALSRNIASLDTKIITSYALYILIGIIFYLLIPYLHLINNSLLLLFIIIILLNINVYKNNISNSYIVLESNYRLFLVPILAYPDYNTFAVYVCDVDTITYLTGGCFNVFEQLYDLETPSSIHTMMSNGIDPRPALDHTVSLYNAAVTHLNSMNEVVSAYSRGDPTGANPPMRYATAAFTEVRVHAIGAQSEIIRMVHQVNSNPFGLPMR
jgi:hypothetical protein